jgi:hypothetical protein
MENLLLRSGDAFFSYKNALLRLPEPTADPESKRLLHEQSHLLSFAGTDFYADMAVKHLTGEKLIFGRLPDTVPAEQRETEIKRHNQAFGGFLEAVPEALSRLDNCYERGTLADTKVTEQLAHCIALYQEIFSPFWKAVVLQTQYFGKPPGGNWQAIPGSSNLEIIMAIVHAVLDWIFVRERGELPADILSKLRDRLEPRKELRIPWVGLSLREHIRELLGYGQRRYVEMFMDQRYLVKTLAAALEEQLHRYVTLIPNVVGLEFTVEVGADGIKASLFSEGAADHLQRKKSYLVRRLRDVIRQDRLANEIDGLVNFLRTCLRSFEQQSQESQSNHLKA